jgi:hypothetical protein
MAVWSEYSAEEAVKVTISFGFLQFTYARLGTAGNGNVVISLSDLK